jgi:hypothetical protein
MRGRAVLATCTFTLAHAQKLNPCAPNQPPCVRVTGPKTSVLVGDSIIGVSAIPYAVDGDRSTASTILWRSTSALRITAPGRGQTATIAGLTAGPSYAVAIWRRSDGKILADSVAITATTLALPPPLSPHAIWYEDFQSNTATSQIPPFAPGNLCGRIPFRPESRR